VHEELSSVNENICTSVHPIVAAITAVQGSLFQEGELSTAIQSNRQ
jgi:hypothetical protein